MYLHHGKYVYRSISIVYWHVNQSENNDCVIVHQFLLSTLLTVLFFLSKIWIDPGLLQAISLST